VRRRRNNSRPREKRTLIPTFDPQDLAKSIEQEANRSTVSPPFDPASYARIVDERAIDETGKNDTPRMIPAAARTGDPSTDSARLDARAAVTVSPSARVPSASELENTIDATETETIGRQMYGCYLASEFPEALHLAERVLAAEPEHALAQLVADQCRERLMPSLALNPSSVLRLKVEQLELHASRIDQTSSFVLGHVDGVIDAATIAALSGLPAPEALDRLHALLDLGVLEVVNA
jgi:hypothetical protein